MSSDANRGLRFSESTPRFSTWGATNAIFFQRMSHDMRGAEIERGIDRHLLPRLPHHFFRDPIVEMQPFLSCSDNLCDS